MLRVFLWVGLYVIAAASTVAMGAWLLLAPVRAGKFLHDYFALGVPTTRARTAALRLVGAGLLAAGLLFGIRIAVAAVHLVLRG